jgi:O-antigen/teichoic acid export membrane protein
MVDNPLTEPMSPQTHVARGATFIFIQGFLNAALGVLYVWFLMHTKEITGQLLFTESDFGFYTMLSFILTLASTIGILALTSASVKHVAQYIAEGKEREAKSVMTRVLQVSAITSFVMMTVLLASAGWLANAFSSPLLIFQLLPMAAAVEVFYTQTLGFLQGLQKLRTIALIGIFYTVAQYCMGIILVYSGFGVLGIVISWLLARLLSCLTALLSTYRYVGFSRQAYNIKPLLVFSFPLYVSAILAFIVNWVDQIFVFPFLGLDALGVYSIAVRASVVPNLVSVAITASLFPKMSELHSKLGVDSLRDAFRTSTRYAALIGFPLSLLVATLAYPIIVLFATVRFVDAVAPLAVMCAASLPTALGLAISPALLTLKKTRTASLIIANTILLEAVLSYVSLRYLNMGLGGVAFSRFFAAIAGLLLGVYMLRRFLRIEFDSEAAWKAAMASVIMVLSIFVMEFVRAMVEPSYQFLVLRLRLLPVYGVVSVTVYLIFLIVLKTVKKRDVELLREYLPAKLGRIADFVGRIARTKE